MMFVSGVVTYVFKYKLCGVEIMMGEHMPFADLDTYKCICGAEHVTLRKLVRHQLKCKQYQDGIKTLKQYNETNRL